MSDVQDFSQVFTQALEQSIDSVVVIDSQNRVIVFNDAAESLWGYTRDQVLGKNVNFLVPQLIQASHDSYIEANRRSGINKIVGTSRDVLIERQDGDYRWGAMSISRVSASGQEFYAAIIRDITRHHKEHERLQLLSLVVDTSENAIIITDAQWGIVYTNGGFSRMFGHATDEVYGQPLDSVIAPDFDQQVKVAMQEQVMSGGDLSFAGGRLPP